MILRAPPDALKQGDGRTPGSRPPIRASPALWPDARDATAPTGRGVRQMKEARPTAGPRPSPYLERESGLAGDLEDLGPTLGAGALLGLHLVLHDDLFGILDLYLLLALHTVSFSHLTSFVPGTPRIHRLLTARTFAVSYTHLTLPTNR